MRPLAGRVVILTGASRGIGVPLALALAARGARLVLAARDRAGLEDTAAKIRAAGGEAHAAPTDVASASDRAALLRAATTLGPVEGIVHNAGIGMQSAVADLPPEEIARQLAVNLEAPIQLTRAALPAMLERRSGFHVYMSSMSGKSPTPYSAVYTATKHGLVGFAASLGLEVEEAGVHVGVVCPAFVDEVGMFADQGVKAPTLLPAVSLRQVVDATLRVIDGSVEETVTRGPVRPLLALQQLFPRLAGPLLRGMGILPMLRARAEEATEQRKRAG